MTTRTLCPMCETPVKHLGGRGEMRRMGCYNHLCGWEGMVLSGPFGASVADKLQGEWADRETALMTLKHELHAKVITCEEFARLVAELPPARVEPPAIQFMPSAAPTYLLPKDCNIKIVKSPKDWEQGHDVLIAGSKADHEDQIRRHRKQRDAAVLTGRDCETCYGVGEIQSTYHGGGHGDPELCGDCGGTGLAPEDASKPTPHGPTIGVARTTASPGEEVYVNAAGTILAFIAAETIQVGNVMTLDSDGKACNSVMGEPLVAKPACDLPPIIGHLESGDIQWGQLCHLAERHDVKVPRHLTPVDSSECFAVVRGLVRDVVDKLLMSDARADIDECWLGKKVWDKRSCYRRDITGRWRLRTEDDAGWEDER